jgi:hypothetical protein
MIIRAMQPQEIDSVIILFDYYRESALIDDDHYDENRVIQTVREYCIRPNLFFRIALNGQRPIGIVGGFLSEDPIDTEVTATIQFLYLIPEYATIENYDQMINEFESWAEQFSVTAIRAIDIGNNPNRLSDVYAELEFDPIRISIMNKELA